MAGQNFINQFKNTRRQVRVQYGKNVKNSERDKKKPFTNRRMGGKFPAGKVK
jgi:hypothetical protein